MGLFSHNVNTNILISIEYIVTLLNAGYSRENILFNLSKKKFSQISSFSKKAIRKINSGKSYSEVLSKIYEHQSHKNMKRFISILNADSNSDIVPMLNDLSGQIMKEKQLVVDSLLDNITSKMQKLMMVIALPLLIFFVIIIEHSLDVVEFIPRPELDYLVYCVTALILVVLMLKMRYKE